MIHQAEHKRLQIDFQNKKLHETITILEDKIDQAIVQDVRTSMFGLDVSIYGVKLNKEILGKDLPRITKTLKDNYEQGGWRFIQDLKGEEIQLGVRVYRD